MFLTSLWNDIRLTIGIGITLIGFQIECHIFHRGHLKVDRWIFLFFEIHRHNFLCCPIQSKISHLNIRLKVHFMWKFSEFNDIVLQICIIICDSKIYIYSYENYVLFPKQNIFNWLLNYLKLNLSSNFIFLTRGIIQTSLSPLEGKKVTMILMYVVENIVKLILEKYEKKIIETYNFLL